jgi:hypothetical protein
MTKRIDKIDEDLSLGLYINGDRSRATKMIRRWSFVIKRIKFDTQER